ncbi:MAG: MBG domain-containing protein [Arcobacter sp.]|uniref:MBG domain-containing protein n=1 Tax=Arcobacter sp. TaxID=1872629 RepID=UPI002A760B87|nr:MBG domain-containing protein [Arcobacter sp.]MDY3199906.1 MBG domain-containing protein [Arcobacter sp.]
MKFKSDFSSRFRILKGGKISLMVSALLGSVTLSVASPTAGVVTSGTANISQSGNTTNINQSSNKATINWQDFSIKSNETVNFNQPNKNSITLNRVVGNEKSVIDGALNANGQVWILNSNGVLFNKTAKVNTAGIVATTKELSDADFNAGNYNFKGDSKASVINLGTIEVSNSGYVVLASNEVKNAGTIKAVKGKVYLSGADKYSLNLNGNSLVSLSVKKGVLDALVENSGTVIANGGEIYLSTNAVNELLKGVVNNTGILEANSLDGVTGKVELFAHGGEVQVGGTIKAKDGFVETSGKKFSIDKNTNIKAKTWLIDPTNITVNDATAYETALGNGTNTLIKTDNATGTDEGNIYINDTINWTTNAKLTLDAYNNIYINKAISASNGKLALYYGDSGDYYINAKVNLSAGQNFFTKKASDLAETSWTVVTTASDVQSMSLSGNTVLGADVDASGISNWTPIGNFSTRFTGNFDGLGHTIDKLYINNSSFYLGLFGATNSSSTIKNVGLINVNIIGNNFVGGLVGASSSTIKNSYVSGTVSGDTYIGGLVGWNDSTIENSYASATVSGYSFVGGLVGINTSTIKYSYASGTVNGYSDFGGLVGSDNNIIENSYYNKDTNTASMGDSYRGKTKAEILAAFAGNTAWVTTGADIVGYGIFDSGISLPLLKTFATPTSTLFESGYGTEESAYIITNWTQLQNINNSNILTKNYYFQLLNNLSNTTSDYTNLASSTANGGAGWNPLGNDSAQFKGNFDGLGHTISDLYINRPTTHFIGLFGYTNGATIRNIGIKGTITGDTIVGGLVGFLFGSTVEDSYSNVTVSGKDSVGGLVGFNRDASTIKNSYATGTVSGTTTVGGLVGYNGAASSIENSYASGTVEGVVNVGGLVGNNDSTIKNSYASGTVEGGHGVGGLVGVSSPDIENSYYDKDTNTDSSMDDISYGRTKAEILALVGGAWDNTIWSKTSGGSSVEGYEILELPYLIGVTRDEDKSVVLLFNSGLGTSVNPYTIKNWTQLQNINNSNILTKNYYFQLLNNLSNTTSDYTNLASSTANSGAGWNPLGKNDSLAFTGNFDGLGHTIDSLYINRSDIDNVGLFGLTNGSSIKNIGLINTTVTGKDYVGALVGLNKQSIVKNVYSSNGSISGKNSLGGLIGNNINFSSITNSYASGSVTGIGSTFFTGGLVGSNSSSSTIENSYFTGSITGQSYVGGLVGVSRLDAGIIKDSFYNNETSNFNGVGGNGSNGNPVNGVTGLTTAQMSYGQIFKDASWDIVADSSVTSSTPVLKYDSVNSKYYWAIAPLSLSYTLGTKTSQYNGLTQNLSSFYTTATSIFGNDYSFLDGTYKFQINETDVTGYKNAAAYENIKVASTNDFLNIASSGNTDGSLTITPKAISVSAENKSKIYGNVDVNLTYTTTGLVGSDTLSGSLKRVSGENVGEYVISQNTLANLNYTITFTNGKYSITPKAITVSANDLSKIYGQTDSTLTYTTTGLVGNDTLSGSLKRVSGENVGEYTISQDTTLSNSNYTVTFTNGKYTITPKAITVSAENKSKTQGENNPSLTYVVNGLIGNDILIGNLNTTATVSSDVGTYEITQGDLANGNYAITFNDGELTILAKNTPTPNPEPTPTPNPEPTPTPNPEPTPTPPDLSKIIDNIDKTIRVNVPNRGFIPPVASTTNSTQSNNGQEVNNIGSVNPDEGGIIVDRNSNVRIINGGVKLPIGLTLLSDTTPDNQIGETN